MTTQTEQDAGSSESAGNADFVEACRALAPRLAERATEAEDLRRLPDATMADAFAAGLFDAVVPTSLGGRGLGLRDLANGTRELAHGCPASGWTLSFLVLHAWLLAKLPPAGRELLYADGAIPLAPAPLAPTGRAEIADGGLRISGRWDWATSVMHADWVMVHAVQTEPAFETWFAVLPIAEVEVEDVWFMSGMRATGSNTVVVRDRFVPDALTLRGRSLLDGTGDQPAGDGMAGLPVPPVLAMTAAATALGAAEAAVELYQERLAERVLAYSLGDKAAEQPGAQMRLASAMSDVAAARRYWDATIDALEAAARSDAGVDEALRVATRLAAADTVRRSRLVIDAVCAGAGASVQKLSHPLQRLQRDVDTLQGHVIFDWDRATELAGRHALGFPLRPADMV